MQQISTSTKLFPLSSSTPSRSNEQYETIAKAILLLAGRCDGASTRDGQGFNGVDAEFGHSLADHLSDGKQLSHRQAYLALKMCRKYWRQLRKAGIELPKDNEFQQKLEAKAIDEAVWLVRNLSKGSEYRVSLDDFGSGVTHCECEAFKFGNWCDHAVLVEEKLSEASSQMRSNVVPLVQAPKTVVQVVEDVSPIKAASSLLKNKEEEIELADRFEEYEIEAIDFLSGIENREEILPGIVLNGQQWKALISIEEYLRDRSRKTYLLNGYAGTGKTTLLQAVLKRLRDRKDFRRIVFTAPTNKAVKVLGRMASKWNLDIESATCHQLLGLRPQIDSNTGKQKFVKDRKEESKIEQFDLVVVDEASMLGEELFDYLLEEVSYLTRRTQILFVGDDAQLPPVGETIGKAFISVPDRVSLTEVVRYGGAIGVLAERIRIDKELPILKKETDEKGDGIYVFSADSWHMQLLQAFQSQKYREDPDFCRALAYTNKRVDALNKMIRNAFYGADADQFVKGERVVMYEAYAPADTVLVQNSEECEVIDAVRGRIGEFGVWYLTLRKPDGIQTVPVIDVESLPEFDRRQNQLSKHKRWHEYWQNRKNFAWLNYAYAMTIHKSQGSTFQNVFVDIPDIVSCRQNLRERPNLLYTACTRASKRLLLMQ